MKNERTRPRFGAGEQIQYVSEFRQDPVSGDWILLAPVRGKRYEFRGRSEITLQKDKCPFENPAKYGNKPPVLVYQNNKGDDWFLQIIPNKYPALGEGSGNGNNSKSGNMQKIQVGVGFHEIVVYRDHDRYLANFSREEIKKVFMSFQERYKTLAKEKFVKYISIFHNHGKEAGSTVAHPHSQILAMPILSPDISRSVEGSDKHFRKNGRCVHCEMLKGELKSGERIVYKNKEMIVLCPFASRAEFEIRIFPKKHFAYFEKIDEKILNYLADAFKFSLSAVYKKLKDPAFNFFIHTAPVAGSGNCDHYHWHMEILPKFDIFGGFELGTGMDIITLEPEKAAEILRK